MPYERQRIHFILALSIIATGSVVTKNIPEGELWGGTPAMFIKKISKFIYLWIYC